MRKDPKDFASEIVYKYYNLIEHKLSEDYSVHDWAISKNLALESLEILLNFLQMDDEFNGDAHNANSPSINYIYSVISEITIL